MIDDFEAVMMKMEEIHSQFPALRFCQVIGNASGEQNYYLFDDDLLTALETYLKREMG